MRTRSAVSIKENPSVPDPTLLWYSRAIGVMRKRPFTRGNSWRFQGAVHDYSTNTDPYQSPTDPPPPNSVQRTYWKKCQHSSWFFVPWHRMYLFHFEQMVADAVVEAGGPSEWTLPYWDYGPAGLARKLPWAFRQPKWPGGEANNLYVSRRANGINAGTTTLSSRDVDSVVALSKLLFSTSPTASDVEFGGPRAKNHDGGALPFGGVESSPHNHVHVAVGGPQGFMYDPTLAALDPIFWLHHSNIDRLWEVWIRQAGRQNPTQSAWQTGVTFSFKNAKDKPVTMTSSQVVDTKKLGYVYSSQAPVSVAAMRPTRARKSPRRRRAAMIGASARPFVVKDDAKDVRIPTSGLLFAAPQGVEELDAAPSQVLLHLENLTGKESAGSYDVYLNLPPGANPEDHADLFAGRVSMFGAKAANRRTRSHARSGFSFVLDVSDLVQSLSGSEGWDPEEIRATLVPVYDWSDAVTVGRVSLSMR